LQHGDTDEKVLACRQSLVPLLEDVIQHAVMISREPMRVTGLTSAVLELEAVGRTRLGSSNKILVSVA